MVSELHSRVIPARKVAGAFWFLVIFSTAVGLSCRTQPRPQKNLSPTPTPIAPATVQKNPIGPAGFPPAVLNKPYPGTGVVTTINLKEGWVEINHDEIKDLMPAMQMEFWVRDPSLMKRISVGDKVDFVLVEDSKGEYLTDLKRAGSP